MKPTEWLLCNDDFDSNDWMYEWARYVGVFNKDFSLVNFCFSRFSNYENTDCPKCGKLDRHYEIEDNVRFKCKKCSHKFSVTSGTYLDSSNVDAAYWDRLIYVLVKMRSPIDSCFLSRDLGLTQKTVYGMLITIKEALDIKCKGIYFKIPPRLLEHQLLSKLLKLKQ